MISAQYLFRLRCSGICFGVRRFNVGWIHTTPVVSNERWSSYGNDNRAICASRLITKGTLSERNTFSEGNRTSAINKGRLLTLDSILQAGTVGSLHFNKGRVLERKSIIQRVGTNRSLRLLSTSSALSSLNVRPLKITSRLAAEQLVRDMTEDERNRLFGVLQDLEQELLLEQGVQVQTPTFKQLWLLAFTNSIPFVGFGFLDNAIMILAGEYIDHTVGVAFGISTMAAAAIGNMFSDIAGIGLAGYVEVWASRLGFEEPTLTPLQLTMRQSRIACHLGRAIGIVIGCIIGMLPLLFITPINHEHAEGSEHHHDK